MVGWRFVAAVAAVALGASACGAAPSPSVAVDQQFASLEFGRIVVEDVQLRSEPDGGIELVSTSGDLDQLVLILERRAVDGRDWLRVQHWSPRGHPALGWLPAAHGGRSVLEPAVPVCPDNLADLALMTALGPAERLACFGGREIVLAPVIGRDEGREVLAGGTPAWLAEEPGFKLYGRAGWDSNDVPLPVHVDPIQPVTLPEGRWLEVRGRFDLPASATCVRRQLHAEIPVGSPAEQVLWCRQQFVVTAVREIQAPEATPGPAYDGSLAGRWTPMALAPIAGRTGHATVWTGREMIVWGGEPGPATAEDPGPFTGGDGAAYDPATDTWRVIEPGPLGERSWPLATWTGSEMLVLGGSSQTGGRPEPAGAAFDPLTDRWRVMAPGPMAGGTQMVAAWTGSEWLVLAGITDAGPTRAMLAAYDPHADSWRELAPVDLPPAHSAAFVWADDRAVLIAHPNSGASVLMQYDPVSDRWGTTGGNPLDGLFSGPDAIWTGREVVLPSRAGRDVPGVEEGHDFIAAYDPVADTWRVPRPPPLGLRGAPGVWTGRFVLYYGYTAWDTAAFDPDTGEWLAISPPEDRAREAHSQIWTGHQLLIWGGGGGESFLRPPDGLRWTPEEP